MAPFERLGPPRRRTPFPRRNLILLLCGVGLLGAVAMGTMLLLRKAADLAPVRTGVQVFAAAPALPVEQQEHLIALPLEAALGRVPGLALLETRCSEGGVLVRGSYELAPRPDGTDAHAAFRTALAAALAGLQLPEDVDPPVVATDRPRRPLLRYWITCASCSSDELAEVQAELVRPALLALPGVSAVTRCGAERAVKVQLDPARLAALGVDFGQVAAALRQLASPPLPGRDQRLINIDQPVVSIDQLSRQVVLRRPQGEVRLMDLARLSVDAAPTGCVCMHGGRDAICGTVWGTAGTVDPGARLRALTQQLATRQIRIATGDPHVLRVALPPDRTQDTAAAASRLWQALAPTLGGKEALLLLGRSHDALDADRDGEIWLATGAREQELLRSAARVPGLSLLPGDLAGSSTVRVYGEDLEGLAATAQRLQDRLRALPGVQAVEVVGLERRQEIELKLDRDRLARFGLRPADVQLHLRAALDGLELGTIGPKHLPLRLVLRSSDRPGRASVEDLQRVTVQAPAGAVPLAQLGALQLTSQPGLLLRRNGRRCVAVRAWGPQGALDWPARFAHATRSVTVPADQKIEIEPAPAAL